MAKREQGRHSYFERKYEQYILNSSFKYYQGYQFWSRADEDGYFLIDHVRPGDYNLYAWVPGFIGDYRYDSIINITEGSYFFYYDSTINLIPINVRDCQRISTHLRNEGEFISKYISISIVFFI